MKNSLTFFLILIASLSYGQVTFSKLPLNKQLVGRDVATNTGNIIVEGEVNNTGATYDAIEVELYRDEVLQNSSTQTQLLTFSGNLAPFNFTIPIVAELHNYSIKIYGKQGSTLTLEKEVVELVAGDVYIIQGQSNAVAEMTSGSANANINDFIRVYAFGDSDEADLLGNDTWYRGQGDGDIETNGNVGQWGLKLARMLVDNHNIPVAIFNGAHPGVEIAFFQRPPNYQTSLDSNYGRLYYRLNKTGLKNKVRAVFWSQGEQDGGIGTPLTTYKNSFITLKNSWQSDYSAIEKFYIFQTKNGCWTDVGKINIIKEAQRQLAFENADISIMPTAALDQEDDCHFKFVNGYEEFGKRLFPLVNRDIYGVNPTPAITEIDAPMIQSASLVNPTTLEVVTDATSLSIATVAEDFLLENASQVNITNTITNIAVLGNKIIFTLSTNPGANATISYLAQDAGATGKFITNSNDIEILCFYRYPIQAVPPTNGSSLLITQYYEGTGNNQWIEVKNITSNPIAANTYNLALYTSAPATGVAPTQFIAIEAMAAGEVRLYKNPNATLPVSLGGGVVTPTNVCTFDGDDVILISTSTGTSCFDDRIDIIGNVPLTNWGTDKSFTKGCNTTEVPALTFDINEYIELALDEVDNAISGTNIALGTHNLGPTTWTTTWSNGTSDRTRAASIDGTYTATDGSFGACDLTVSTTGNLNFENDTSNYIEVNKSLTNSGTITIGDKESLYTVNTLNPNTPVVITGNITKKETTAELTDVNDYTYWSSPVVGANMSTVFASPIYNQGRLYYWDQSLANTIPGGGSEALGEWISAENTVMESGRGYISQGPVGATYPLAATVNFSGIPHTGEIQLTNTNNAIVYNDNNNVNDDLNLIGNPYPSAIDADLFISDPQNVSSIEGTIWFWTHQTPNNQSATGEQYTGDDYASYNLTGGVGSGTSSVAPTKFIGSGQGFVVQANSTEQQVTFTDAMRVRSQQNVQFFKNNNTKKNSNQEKDRIWLNIESSEGGAASQILIGFFDNATDSHDRLYDGIKLSAGYVNFYSKIGDTQYGIQGLNSFNTDKQVPLGFDTYIDDASVTYTISIDHLEGVLNDAELYLVDHKLNTIHDLKQAAYNFTVVGEGSYTDRFTLQFTNSTLNVDDVALTDFTVVNEDDNLLIKSGSTIRQVKVYDMLGRLLINNKPNKNEVTINTQRIKKGTVLLLNITFENGVEISKKAIKY